MGLLVRGNPVTPGAPGTVTCVATAVDSSTISVAASGSAPAGWRSWEIFESDTSGGTFVSIATDIPPQSMPYLRTGLGAGVTRYYKVLGTANDGQFTAQSAEDSGTTTASSSFSPNFPRLGSYYISPAQWGNAANDARLALCCNVIFTHYNQAQAAAGRTLRAAIDAIKTLVPAGMNDNPVHSAYIINDEVPNASSGDTATQRLRDELSTNRRYLYVSGDAGTIVISSFSASLWLCNRTAAAPVVAGKTWTQWYAELMRQQNVTGEPGNTANPSLDAMFLDNCYFKPRKDGDYNRDGITDSASSSDYALSTRTGIKDHFDYIRSLLPSMRFQLGNISDLTDSQGAGLYASSFTPDYSAIAPLFGVIDGGIAGEYFIDNATINGEPGNSKEYQERANGLYGFYASRNILRFQDAIVTNAALNIYSVRDVTGDLSSADKQRLRFGAAFITVCSDGAIDDGHILDWGTMPLIYTDGGDIGWLGAAAEPARSTQYNANGIYGRSFANGFVALNPRNNGTKTFTVPVDTRDVETGTTYAASATITLLDRDGVFLKYT